MTRNRVASDGAPIGMNAAYYARRASMALLITQRTQPSEDGQGYPSTQGVRADANVPLNEPYPATFYGGGKNRCPDFPVIATY